jgi:hypothetical protein
LGVILADNILQTAGTVDNDSLRWYLLSFNKLHPSIALRRFDSDLYLLHERERERERERDCALTPVDNNPPKIKITTLDALHSFSLVLFELFLKQCSESMIYQVK